MVKKVKFVNFTPYQMDQIRTIRRLLGLSIDDLHALTGYGHKHISTLERGECEPAEPELRMLTAALYYVMHYDDISKDSFETVVTKLVPSE